MHTEHGSSSRSKLLSYMHFSKSNLQVVKDMCRDVCMSFGKCYLFRMVVNHMSFYA